MPVTTCDGFLGGRFASLQDEEKDGAGAGKPRPYDRLGDGHATAGKGELAIANSSKPLELNPTNTNATQMLERLKAR